MTTVTTFVNELRSLVLILRACVVSVVPSRVLRIPSSRGLARGGMERVIVAGARFYRIPGREQLYPSVTTVLNVISKRVMLAPFFNSFVCP